MAAKNGDTGAGRTRGPIKAYKSTSSTSGEVSARASRYWAQQTGGQVLAAITAVTAVQGGLLCGATRDGGNPSVVLYYDGDKRRFYPEDAEQLEDLLVDIIYWTNQDAPSLTHFD